MKHLAKWMLSLCVLALLGTLLGCEPMSIDPSGRFAYVAQRSGNVAAYVLDPVTGTPNLVGLYPVGTSLVSTAIDPSGRFLYVLAANPAKIAEYAIDQTSGGLTPLMSANSPAAVTWADPQPDVIDMTVDPSGRNLFVVDNAGGVYQFTTNPATGIIDANGALVEYPTPTSPVAATVHPSGRFLFTLLAGYNPAIAGTGDKAIPPSIKVLLINGQPPKAGVPALSDASETIIDNGLMPTGLAIDRGGNYLFVSYVDPNADETASGVVIGYRISKYNGAVTPISVQVGVEGGPITLRFDPSNRFLYVGNQTSSSAPDASGSISVFAFDKTTGALAPVAGAPFLSSMNMDQIVVTGVAQPGKN